MHVVCCRLKQRSRKHCRNLPFQFLLFAIVVLSLYVCRDKPNDAKNNTGTCQYPADGFPPFQQLHGLRHKHERESNGSEKDS